MAGVAMEKMQLRRKLCLDSGRKEKLRLLGQKSSATQQDLRLYGKILQKLFYTKPSPKSKTFILL